MDSIREFFSRVFNNDNQNKKKSKSKSPTNKNRHSHRSKTPKVKAPPPINKNIKKKPQRVQKLAKVETPQIIPLVPKPVNEPKVLASNESNVKIGQRSNENIAPPKSKSISKSYYAHNNNRLVDDDDYSIRSTDSFPHLIAQNYHRTKDENESDSDMQAYYFAQAHQTQRHSLGADDLAKLMEGLDRDAPGKLPFGDESAKEKLIRMRLNETVYELMLARKNYEVNGDETGNLKHRTSSKKVSQLTKVTGIDAVDTFVAERAVRMRGNSDYVQDSDDEENTGSIAKTSEWQSSSAWRRGLFILLLILGFITLSHIASFLFLTREWILEGIDNETNPCDNFYLFACGKYMRDHKDPDRTIYKRVSETIPFNYVSNEGLGRVLQRVKNYPLNQILPFYQACIDQDERNIVGFKPFLHLLLQLKLVDPIKSGTLDISRTIIRIYKKVNKRIFIDIYSTRQNFIVLNLGQPEKEYSLTSATDYALAMREAFRLLQSELRVEDEEEINTIIYVVMRFEAELIYILSKESMNIFGFPDEMGKYIDVPDSLHPNFIVKQKSYFRFDSFMSELFEHQRDFKNVTVFFNYIHSILKQDERLYMRFLEDFLNRTPYYVILRYFQWTLIKHFAFDLTWDLQETMVKVFRWVGSLPAERCFRNMFSKLHVLAATRYSKELTNLPKLDKKMADIVSKTWKTLNNLTEKIPSSGLVESLKETISTFSIVETFISDFEPFITDFYNGLDMKMNTHFENILQATALKAQNDLLKLQNIPPFHLWPPGEYSVDEIKISIMQNTREAGRYLNIPFGALQQPYMGNDLPIFNYGGFGFWISAYYLMHYSIYDLLKLHAKERETSEPETLVIAQKQMEKVLLPRLECIIAQYRDVIAHGEPESKMSPTAEPSRVKNFAFVMAVELLIHTIEKYKNDTSDFPPHQVLPGLEKYTVDQLLFLSITRHFCKAITTEKKKYMSDSGNTIPEFKINAAFRNSQYFTRAWSCPKKRFMNPKKKCKFF